MPDYDARTADEIRADGDEMSVLNAYTEAFTGNSQPGQVNAAGESIHGDYGEQDFPTHEDDPRWYEDAEDDSYEPEQPAAGQFDTSQIAQQVAEDWAAARLDPNQAMAQQFVGVVDQRIQAQLEGKRRTISMWAKPSSRRSRRRRLSVRVYRRSSRSMCTLTPRSSTGSRLSLTRTRTGHPRRLTRRWTATRSRSVASSRPLSTSAGSSSPTPH